mgnify:CR=1 FL=1
MKKTVLYTLVWLIAGCAIYIPAPHSNKPLPTATTGIEFNTYSSGWGWTFLRWPGIGWGHQGYGGYYGGYGYGYPYYGHGYGHDGYGYRHHGPRWIPGHYE